ncbi:MAG: ATP-dependent helicase HrpB [Pseudomonadota bacterium]
MTDDAVKPAVQAIIEPLRHALRAGNAVLEAEPGAGKSTLIPLALLDLPCLSGRRLVMLEPRRVAARAVAERLAHNLGERLGERVGLVTRDQRVLGPHTRIEVVTEGVLTRRLQGDPTLQGVGLVVFDEAHERGLQADLALALCLDVQRGLREDLRVLLMSATVNARAVETVLPAAPVLRCAGRQHAVDVVWLAQPAPAERPAAAARAVCDALAAHSGDVLVFLPGLREIRAVDRQLAPRLDGDTERVWLHGTLDSDAQRAALAPASRRRVILSSAIAETSVTLPGVRVVVDLGLERRAVFDAASGFSRLSTVAASQASADQRAGRAGRVAPGTCYRLWGEAAHRRRPPHWRAEVLDADLCDLVLQLRVWGVTDAAALPWQDAPPAAHLALAEATLQRCGVLGDTGQVTALGRQVAELGLPTRLGVLAAVGSHHGCLAFASDLAAQLAEPPRGERHAADFARARDRASVRRLRRRVRERLGSTSTETPLPEDAILVRAFADRVGVRRDNAPQRYRLGCGLGVSLLDDDPLVGEDAIVVFEVGGEATARSRDRVVRRAVAIDLDAALAHCGHLCHTDRHCGWDDDAARVVARERVQLGALVVRERALGVLSDADWCAGLMEAVRVRGLGVLSWNDAAEQLQARVAFARRVLGDDAGLPALDTATLMASLDTWLAPRVHGVRSFQGLSRVPVAHALLDTLNWAERQRLDAVAPVSVSVPSGRAAALQYSESGAVLAIKLQEVFGLTESPRVAAGREAVSLHLLSPAGRPLAVTRDIASFWSNAYPEVRREMRGRYPKHPWPADPLTAQATAKTTRALGGSRRS